MHGSTDAPAFLTLTDFVDLLNSAVVGLPSRQRDQARRELSGYLVDLCEELAAEGLSPEEIKIEVCRRFGAPERVAVGFQRLPPPRWQRSLQRGVAPMTVSVLGLVLGLGLVQVRMPHPESEAARAPAPVSGRYANAKPLPSSKVYAGQFVREVPGWSGAGAARTTDYLVAARLGVPALATETVLEPSVPAFQPRWLPQGFDPERGQLFLTASATVQYFPRADGFGAGIIVEALRPERSTVFQVKERHVFPLNVGGAPGFYIDGEWEVRGPVNEQPAPATWRTDLSHSLLFVRGDYLVLVAGPADVLNELDLLKVAESLR